MKQTIGNLTSENVKNAARIRQMESSNEELTSVCLQSIGFRSTTIQPVNDFQLAEKRKNMMEDFYLQCSKSVEQVKLELKSAVESESQLREELKVCQLQNCEMETSLHRLSEENQALTSVMDQLKSQNSQLSSKLATVEQSLEEARAENSSTISSMQNQHSSTLKVQKLHSVLFVLYVKNKTELVEAFNI